MASQRKRPLNNTLDEGASTSQAKVGSSKESKSSSNLDFSEQDRRKLVSDVVFFFLAQEQKRVPHTKGEVFKAVGLSGQHKELQEDILQRAFKKLEEVFGIAAKNLPGDRQGFVLLNKLDQNLGGEDEFIQWTEEENAIRGFLTSILSLIFMSGGVVKEDQLVLFLTKMGLHGDTTDEATNAARELIAGPSGNVKQFLEKDLGGKQRYISVTKIDAGDAENPVHEYRWGERAILEVKKSQILKQVSKLYKCHASAFSEQFEQVKQEEGPDVFDDDEPMDQDEEEDGED